MKSYLISKTGYQSVHLTCGIRRHFRAFFGLRVFPAPKHNPRPMQGVMLVILSGSEAERMVMGDLLSVDGRPLIVTVYRLPSTMV